jgi:hypothetical protein
MLASDSRIFGKSIGSTGDLYMRIYEHLNYFAVCTPLNYYQAFLYQHFFFLCVIFNLALLGSQCTRGSPFLTGALSLDGLILYLFGIFRRCFGLLNVRIFGRNLF